MMAWYWWLLIGFAMVMLPWYVAGYMIMQRTCVVLMRRELKRLQRESGGVFIGSVVLHFDGVSGFDMLSIRWILRLALHSEYPDWRINYILNVGPLVSVSMALRRTE